MSTFETLLLIILGVHVLGGLYFAITGRILNKKSRKEDMELADKSLQWEEQLKVLTNRMGQLATENQRLADTNRQWQAAYSDIYRELQEYKKKYEPDPVVILNDAEEKNVNEQSPKGGHMNVSDKMDMEKQFGEEQ